MMTTVKWIIAGGLAGLLTFSHFYAYNAGKNVIISRLQTDKIKVLKDGKEIDAAVLAADDVELCERLGGCL